MYNVLNIRSIYKENLSTDDVLVIIAGSNDVTKNESIELLTNLNTILGNTSGTNIVLLELQNRLDDGLAS